MKAGSNATPKTWSRAKGAFASVAAEELQLRIAASGLSEAMARMACELCLEDISVEEAFQKIQESAIEKMVHMLDSTILADEGALASCLETVTAESERVAWQALEKGTEELRDGLTILEEIRKLETGGYVN
jgi:hypothetical protein